MKIIVILLGLALIGCESQAERQAQIEAHDHAVCVRYGFKPGTDPFANCMLTIAKARYDAASRTHAAAVGAFLNSLPGGH